MLKSLLISLTLASCALCATIPAGMHPQPDGRIVGGSLTNIESFPWQVSIQRNGAHSCGGAIYKNQVVITAAHCLQQVTTSMLKVRAGSTQWNSGGTLIAVYGMQIHEGYNPITMANDIAVLHLQTSFSFGSTVQQINLASNPPTEGTNAVVSGWGSSEYGYSALSTNLEYVEVQTISTTQCGSAAYGYGSKILPSMLCAAAPGKDACQGDSGGPLVAGGRLIGIVSWGYGCAFPNYPGVYANVAQLHSWITNAADQY